MEPIKLIAVLLLGAIVARSMARRWSLAERRVVMLCVVAHGAGSIAQELVYRFVYGGGDMFLYQRNGVVLERYMSFGSGNLTDVLKLLFQTDREPLPFYVIGAGSSTGSMSAVSAFITTVLSNELYVMGALIGVFAVWGTTLMYGALRPEIPPRSRPYAAAALFLLPSVVFWSSALLKESVVATGVGLTVYGVFNLFVERKLARGVLAVVVGTVIVGLFKAYVIAGFFAATPPLLLAVRAKRSGRVLQLSLSRTLGLVGGTLVFVLLFGQLFEQYQFAELATELSMEQAATQRAAGGSTYQLVDANATSLAGQLAYAPLAIATTFFRPLIFEAHNSQALANALEATFLLGLFILGVRRTGPRGFTRFILERPMMLFSTTYVLVVALGVGLATTNLGTLSRYRIPMYGLFGLLLVLFAGIQTREVPNSLNDRPVDL